MPVTDKEHLDALASNRKLSEELDGLRAKLAEREKAAAAAPPPQPAPAPAPAPAPPPFQMPRSALDLVGRPIAEQETLQQAFEKSHGTKERLFDHLMRTSYGSRVTVADPGIYTPGEFRLRPTPLPAPAPSGRKTTR